MLPTLRPPSPCSHVAASCVDQDGERLMALLEEHAPSEQQADRERVFAPMETTVHQNRAGTCRESALIQAARRAAMAQRCSVTHSSNAVTTGMPAYLESSNRRNIPL